MLDFCLQVFAIFAFDVEFFLEIGDVFLSLALGVGVLFRDLFDLLIQVFMATVEIFNLVFGCYVGFFEVVELCLVFLDLLFVGDILFYDLILEILDDVELVLLFCFVLMAYFIQFIGGVVLAFLLATDGELKS